MERANAVRMAYRQLGSSASFYDGMMTCTTILGTLVSRLVWGIGPEANGAYLLRAMEGIPEGFSGRLLEVPVGTGVLTMPLYKTLPNAQVTCVDYSSDMMAAARAKADAMGLANVCFRQGDVGGLPYADDSFDAVLSLNGFHAFPDKAAAFAETLRVLKTGGLFCGCFYVKGGFARTDWFVDRLYVPRGFFTPPFDSAESLARRLGSMYSSAKVDTFNSLACFTCVK